MLMTKNLKYKFNRRSGQSLVELMGGLLLIIPVALLLLDAGVILAANLSNVDLSKRAARAAASVLNNDGQSDGQTSLGAASQVTENFAKSSTISKVEVSYFDWEPNSAGNSFSRGAQPAQAAAPLPGQVTVVTSMTIVPPVCFPGMPKSLQANAQSIQPIVGLPPVAPIAQQPIP